MRCLVDGDSARRAIFAMRVLFDFCQGKLTVDEAIGALVEAPS